MKMSLEKERKIRQRYSFPFVLEHHKPLKLFMKLSGLNSQPVYGSSLVPVMFCFLPLCMWIVKGSSTNIKAPKGFLLTISKTKMKTKSGQTWKEATKVLATWAPTPLHLQNSRPCFLGTQKGTNVFVASLFLSFFSSSWFFLSPTFLLCSYSSTAFCCMLSKADRRGLPSETWRRLRCRHHLCSNPPVSVWRFTLLLVSDQVPHSSHSPWKSCLWGPLHPKKAPRRLRALSAGNSSSGALKSYIRHTSSAVAGTLTGRCKSHKDSLQDRTHINQHEEAAKILHSVVWEQPHRQVWLGTQSMGSQALTLICPPSPVLTKDQAVGLTPEWQERTPWVRSA